jgi:membrane protease subunit (stomatin/prohibitin family)
MPGFRGVISTLMSDGKEMMAPDVLLFHYPDNSIVNGSLLTVESNHFCVLKSRGAILNVYETGQYVVQTPDHPIFGVIQQAFYGGASPWQYEAIYINRSKLVVRTKGTALSREMAELAYSVDYYIHVKDTNDAVALVQHMPIAGHMVTTLEVDNYAGPVVEQAINEIAQVTPLERVNEKIRDVCKIVHDHLQEFLAGYGITLDTVKVLLKPSDDRMRALISLRAFGLSELDAVRYYTAMMMAERGLISAPNVAIGAPFMIGGMGSGGAALPPHMTGMVDQSHPPQQQRPQVPNSAPYLGGNQGQRPQQEP